IAMVAPARGEDKAAKPAPAIAPVPQSAKEKAGDVKQHTTAPVYGLEIFMRECLPKTSRSHGGDGLGPVFNDSSCVACHNQGGAGGGGTIDTHDELISRFTYHIDNEDN